MALSDNLEKYFSLDETSGNRECEITADALVPQNSPSYGTGIQGNAIDIEDDSSQYLYDSSVVSIGSNTDFSVSLWIKIESLPNGGGSHESYGVLSFYDNDGSYNIYRQIDLAGSNTEQLIRTYCAGGGESYNPYNWTSVVATGTWYHIVFTYEYGNVTNGNKLYVNNSLVAQVNSKTRDAGSWSPKMAIGELMDSNGNGYGRYFDGLIDEVGIWSRVLNTDEIEDLYNEGSGRDYDYILTGGSAGGIWVPRTTFM